jgi:hypothetical protein
VNRTRRQTPLSLPPRELRGGKIVLDWKAYFLEFCRVHGEPVLHAGRLIFRDGWSYSSTDFEGPESSPPADTRELDAIVVRYWVMRKEQLDRLLAETQLLLQHYRDKVQSKSLPLRQVVLTEDDAGNKRRGHVPLNLRGLEQKEKWLITDIQECRTRLGEIEQHYKDKRAQTHADQNQLQARDVVPGADR